MIKNHNDLALDMIRRGIDDDLTINPTWAPTRDQLTNRVRNYLRDSDPRLTYDRDMILNVLIFLYLD